MKKLLVYEVPTVEVIDISMELACMSYTGNAPVYTVDDYDPTWED